MNTQKTIVTIGAGIAGIESSAELSKSGIQGNIVGKG